MYSGVISQLASLASTSTMSSKHASAVMCGKRVLATATNYSLFDITPKRYSQQQQNGSYSPFRSGSKYCFEETPDKRYREKRSKYQETFNTFGNGSIKTRRRKRSG